MELTDEELITLNTYNQASATWKDSHNTDNFWRKEMHELASMVSSGSILDVGSGAGRDIRELTKYGFTVDALDPSSGLLELSKKRNPHTVFYQSTIYDAPKNIHHQYDGLWCAAVFLHIPKQRTVEALAAMRKIVSGGGYLFVSTKQGDGEGLESFTYGGEGLQRLMTYWLRDDFERELQKASFEIVHYSELNERHNIWMSFICRAI